MGSLSRNTYKLFQQVTILLCRRNPQIIRPEIDAGRVAGSPPRGPSSPSSAGRRTPMPELETAQGAGHGGGGGDLGCCARPRRGRRPGADRQELQELGVLVVGGGDGEPANHVLEAGARALVAVVASPAQRGGGARTRPARWRWACGRPRPGPARWAARRSRRRQPRPVQAAGARPRRSCWTSPRSWSFPG